MEGSQKGKFRPTFWTGGRIPERNHSHGGVVVGGKWDTQPLSHYGVRTPIYPAGSGFGVLETILDCGKVETPFVW